jgi:enolase-phosphatase E1
MDIEGTTTPISFVRDTLFPYARSRLPDFVHTHANRTDVRAALAEVHRLAPDQPVLDTLLGWMDRDEKVTPLKALQGLIWNEGYESGQLVGRLYADVPPALRGWHASGIRLYVYSSGSEAAQRLIFGHSDAGNLANLFRGFFDTRVGGKREQSSYRGIASGMDLPCGEFLFLSDMEPELDAAQAAGMTTCQVVRAEDGTIASTRHTVAHTFATICNRID